MSEKGQKEPEHNRKLFLSLAQNVFMLTLCFKLQLIEFMDDRLDSPGQCL